MNLVMLWELVVLLLWMMFYCDTLIKGPLSPQMCSCVMLQLLWGLISPLMVYCMVGVISACISFSITFFMEFRS
jgi:hypothetical protein